MFGGTSNVIYLEKTCLVCEQVSDTQRAPEAWLRSFIAKRRPGLCFKVSVKKGALPKLS